MPQADALGQAGIPGEGPYLFIALKASGTEITEAWFETYGCPAAIACGSWLTKWLEGKTLEQAAAIEAEDLMAVLGGLPLGNEHCAHLAVNALSRALRQVPKRHATDK